VVRAGPPRLCFAPRVVTLRGALAPPAAPGHGVAFTGAALKRYAV